MFLRRYNRKKNGKDHIYWALVESTRTERGSRQRVVAYLGELAEDQDSGWATLGRHLGGRARPRPTLFDPPHYNDPDDDEPVLVDLKDVGLERVRDFADVWLAWGLWRLLELDKLLDRLLPQGKEAVRWPLVAAILVIARFCEPGSELHIEEVWYPRTALDDLLGVGAAAVNTDRLYAGLDELLPHKEAIEKHLKERLGDLFELEYDLLLYDITSTYFEGECRSNRMAQRGYSRDSWPDCPQVCIGLVVTHRRYAAGLRGLRRQSRRLDDGRGDRQCHGGQIWACQAYLGDGSWDGQRVQPGLYSRFLGEICGWVGG